MHSYFHPVLQQYVLVTSYHILSCWLGTFSIAALGLPVANPSNIFAVHMSALIITLNLTVIPISSPSACATYGTAQVQRRTHAQVNICSRRNNR